KGQAILDDPRPSNAQVVQKIRLGCPVPVDPPTVRMEGCVVAHRRRSISPVIIPVIVWHRVPEAGAQMMRLGKPVVTLQCVGPVVDGVLGPIYPVVDNSREVRRWNQGSYFLGNRVDAFGRYDVARESGANKATAAIAYRSCRVEDRDQRTR